MPAGWRHLAEADSCADECGGAERRLVRHWGRRIGAAPAPIPLKMHVTFGQRTISGANAEGGCGSAGYSTRTTMPLGAWAEVLEMPPRSMRSRINLSVEATSRAILWPASSRVANVYALSVLQIT